jgi:hypothetical protein
MRTWIAPVAALAVLPSSVTYACADGFQGPIYFMRAAYYYGVLLLVIGGTSALLVFLAGRYARRKDD